MSETGRGASPRARDVKAQAARRLMDRRLAEDWSEADQAALDAWLAESSAHLIAYVRLEAAWSSTNRLVVLRHPSSETGGGKDAQSLRMFIAKIAAVIGVIVVLGIGATNMFLHRAQRVFSTPVGGHEVISFADGSRIELNTNTSLRAVMTDKERTIWLDRGEAYFQVKHDETHPFVVIAGKRRITDLGTKFLVRRDANRLRVALVDGRVRVGTDGSGYKPELLAPGDVAVATGNSISVAKVSPQALSGALSWRRGVLIFKHTTLADAAAEFNRYNQKKLVIADDATGRLKIYGTFRVQDADLFARVAQDVLGLRLESDADEIVISR